MPDAAKRNAIPEAIRFSYPSKQAHTNPSYYVHEIEFSEWRQFQPKSTEWVGVRHSNINIHCLTLNLLGDGVEILYAHRLDIAGFPKRDHYSQIKRLHILPKNAWGQIIYNGRQSMDEGGWLYRKWVFNIVHCTELREYVFHDGQPEYIFKDLANLF